MARLVAAALVAATVTTACGGTSTPAISRSRAAPDLSGFLRLPVATPSSCPSSVSGATSGRRSPWVGHVDISAYVDDSLTTARLATIRAALAALPHVRTVYFETKSEARAEFQRLYTCSADVPPAALPASYRLVLTSVTRPQRDDVVRAVKRLAGVDSVSCDPSSPCVGVA